MEKLILIDGNSLINRAFYATPPMSNSKGVPTNAVLGFINMLLKLVQDEKPTHMLVAFDRKEPTFRHEIYGDYKGTRKPMPEDLRPQIPLLKNVLYAMGIACYDLAGSEADDIIGTAAKRFAMPTVIFTGDKDSFQLVDKTTSVHFTKRGISDIEEYTAENFKEKTSLVPSQIIDLKALMGDKSDNIPGIAGIGEKTALDLISKYTTVEGIYEHTDELKGKLKEKIVNGREDCFLSKRLATIDVNVPLTVSLADMVFKTPFPFVAKQMFADLEFRGLLRKEGLFEATGTTEEAANVEEKPEVVVINSSAQLPDFAGKKVAVYVGDKIHLCFGSAEYVLNIKQSFFDEGFMFDEAIGLIKGLFEDKNSSIIVFSRKKTEHMLSEMGVRLDADVSDISLKKYIADFSGKEEKLEDVVLYYHLPEGYPAYALYRLDGMLDELLDKNGQSSLYRDIELPLAKVLYEMEITGFKVDCDILDELNGKYKAILSDLTDRIHELAGEKFNVNSPKQLAVILFEKLKLKTGKKKNTSTGAEILEELYDDHEIVPLILQYRRISKLNSTYIEGFRPLIDKKTGLIHTVFNQTLTSTGRLSSKEPNLQNLPIRDEEGKEIRRFFVPSDTEHVLVGQIIWGIVLTPVTLLGQLILYLIYFRKRKADNG
ncbi:MAG: DNA polymerase I, partial [Clostridia bacterium]|nr:DNA polymerase I [Clostridia bacterium]